MITTGFALAVTFFFSTVISPVFNTIATKIGGIDVVHGAALVGADMRPISGISYFVGRNWWSLVLGIVVLLVMMYGVKIKPQIRTMLTGYRETLE